MSEHGTKDQSAKAIFDAAGDIAKILENYQKEDQKRILRLIMEGLTLRVPSQGNTETQEAGPDTTSQQNSGSAIPKDIKSFVLEKNPKSDQQFAAVAAYFYRFVAPEDSREEAITSEILQTAGRHARGFAFKKPSVTLNNAVNAGYLDKAGRGRFKINAVGENLVAMTLPGVKQERSDTPTRRKPSKRKAGKVGKKKTKRRRSSSRK